MNHRIAAGALVVNEGRVLLVRHHKPNAYDFWVAPGGGAENGEDLHTALRREVQEESGLIVELTGLLMSRNGSLRTHANVKFGSTRG